MAQSCTTEGYLEAMKEVLVLTERRYEGDGSLSNMPREYVDNVLQEDGLVVDALMRVGFAAKRVAWCNDGIRWDACAQPPCSGQPGTTSIVGRRFRLG